MPSKKKKYNARFPAGRIKKIMQSDEEIGKVAQAVPVIISRTLELFVESLLTKTLRITNARNAKTLSTSHMKQCIMAEQRFDFLKELVKNIPDISANETEEAACNYNYTDEANSSPEETYPDSDTPYDLSLASSSLRGLTNGNTVYSRSVSLNFNGKRQYNEYTHPHPATSTSSSVLQTASSLVQKHQHIEPPHLPNKLTRSESTPTYLPNDRLSSLNAQISKQLKSPDILSAIPAAIYKYELTEPIVKIDYSNMQLAESKPDFALAAPVINIDLTNIVSGGTVASPPTTICYETHIAKNRGVLEDEPDNKSTKERILSEISSAPIIPKAAGTTAPLNVSFFELDEDYDNI